MEGEDLTVTAVLQVGPDDVLLGETEHPQSPAPHAGVDGDARVCHQRRALIETDPSPPHTQHIYC